jgi:hypothetical protein
MSTINLSNLLNNTYQGDVGFVGSRGDVGFTGSQGVGFTGSRGDVGFTGSQGDVGFTGSQGVGFTGSQGDVGFTGSQGAVGFTGSQGDVGFTGSQGDVGFTGSQGAVGFTGSQGDVGFTGSQGDVGSSTPRALTIYNPTDAENVTLFYTTQSLSINSIRAVLTGSSSPSVTFSIFSGSDRSASATTHVNAQTVTNTTSGVSVTVANSTIPADRWVWLTTSATSGLVSSFNTSLLYS